MGSADGEATVAEGDEARRDAAEGVPSAGGVVARRPPKRL
jgi:hypothetical protein